MTWKCIFYPVIWAASLAWGILCAAAFVHPAFEKLTLVIVISTAGLVGAGSESFIPSRPLMLVLLTTYLGPSVLTLAFSGVQAHSVTAVFIIYWFGVYGVTRIQHREYWLGLKNSFLIQKHAAELEKLNTLDGLTGLKNRVFFDVSLSTELKRARRSRTLLSLLFIDIDHFKKVNDRHGHLVGDECLRRLSKLLKDHFQRETDTVARYGGEEFAVIIPDSDREQAVRMAEKLRRAVEAMDLKYGEAEVPLTVSIGVSSRSPLPDDTEASFIELADMNLYRAKHNGRNQVRS